jgi:hypothetical protein
MKKRITRKPEDYTSNFMTRQHQPITDMSQLKRYSFEDVYLFYKGQFIGEGGFEIVSKKKKWLHTEGVSLQKEFRHKGHGIYLYHHLIATAVRLGCKRLYSSETLNKFSRRMWKDKLSKMYKVVFIKKSGPCDKCGHKAERIVKFYIDLDTK